MATRDYLWQEKVEEAQAKEVTIGLPPEADTVTELKRDGALLLVGYRTKNGGDGASVAWVGQLRLPPKFQRPDGSSIPVECSMR